MSHEFHHNEFSVLAGSLGRSGRCWPLWLPIGPGPRLPRGGKIVFSWTASLSTVPIPSPISIEREAPGAHGGGPHWMRKSAQLIKKVLMKRPCSLPGRGEALQEANGERERLAAHERPMERTRNDSIGSLSENIQYHIWPAQIDCAHVSVCYVGCCAVPT